MVWQGPVSGELGNQGQEGESDDDKDQARVWAALRDLRVQRWVVGTVGPWGLQEDRLAVEQVAMGTHGPRDGELPVLGSVLVEATRPPGRQVEDPGGQ